MEGTYVGHHERVIAAMFMTPQGIHFGMALTRKVEGQRFNPEVLPTLRGLPYEAPRTGGS